MSAKLVQMGRFSGADGEPPAAIDIVDVVALLMPLAVAGRPSERELARVGVRLPSQSDVRRVLVAGGRDRLGATRRCR